MALSPGTRLDSYEILTWLGQGGMGEVYRAKDTKLGRDVALKILPDVFTADPERLARFRREAQVLASFNHPHIGAIYGLDEAGARQFLVLELVDGESLDGRIARGPIPVDDALGIATQIAEALEAAHEKGIIHRDLKPANVALTGDGNVKVLDFGLAKAMEPASGSPNGLANAPTITSPAMITGINVILGTAAYMSPEQAKGRPADKRSDVWAFGVVLYEMLTGRRAFDGDDISVTLASVLKDDVKWSSLPPDLPPSIHRLLRRCLEKDPKRRLRAIGDARFELDEAISGAGEPNAAATASAVVEPVTRRSAWLSWTVAGLLGSALFAAMLLWAPWRTPPSPAPRRLLVGIGADASLNAIGPSAILSPDGTTLAFVARQGDVQRLFVRKLEQLHALALPGTDGAASPFFSPNGQWLAFFASAALKKVSVTGGAVVQVCEAPTARGGTWSDDDTIYFTPSATPKVPIMRVAAAGGTPVVAGVLSAGAVSQRWPQALPGSAGVLFSEHSSTINWDSANIAVMPLHGGASKVVLRGGYFGRYVAAPTRAGATRSGYLLYMHQGTVFGVPFDLTRLETIGQAVPVIDDVAASVTAGGVQLDVVSEGTLLYVPGTTATATNAIDWVMRDGTTAPLRSTKADWANPMFSPDGQRLAIDVSDGRQRDIWVYEWSRDTLTQITFDPNDDTLPVWTPDGRHIVFASDRAKKGITNLYWVNADGTGDVTRLTDSSYGQLPNSWHPSGKFLAFSEQNTAQNAPTGFDLMILPMDGDAAKGWTPKTPTAFLATPGTELVGMFSPDGRWIAYISNEHAGVYDVYVRPFPGPGGPWLISAGGGLSPHWSKTANELLFLSGGKMTFAPFTVVGDSFRADKPQTWTPAALQRSRSEYPYDVHPDGKRVAAIANIDAKATAADKVVFVFNVADYLQSTVGR